MTTTNVFEDPSRITGDLAIQKTDTGNPTIIGGTVVVSELSIIVKGGTRINLIGNYSGITIQEDMFASSIIGTIQINDTAGFLETFQIRGGETINMKITKPVIGDIIIWREDLVVHKISRSTVDTTSLGSSFELYFTSKTHINSLKKSIYKSYKSIPYIDAIKSIYTEMSPNDLIIEDPNLTLTKPFVSTGLMPHRALEFLAQRSSSKTKFFTFFERFTPVVGTKSDNKPFAGTHYFGSLEAIIDRYAKSPSDVRIIEFTPNLNAKMENGSAIRTTTFERDENFNHVQAMLLGFYNTTITTIDLISRTHSMRKFGYTTKDSVNGDLYPHKLIDDYNIFSIYNDIKGEIPGKKLIMASINDTGKRSEWLPNVINGQVSKILFKVKIEIQGGTNDVGVGDIVSLFIPSQTAKIVDAKNPHVSPDEIHSGKYFVLSVDHKIRDGEYIKSVTLGRGSSPIDANLLYDVRTTDIDFTQTTANAKKSIGDLRIADIN